MSRLFQTGAVLIFALHSPVIAGTINFDDVDASSGDVVLTNYAGFGWTNLSVYTVLPGFPGFNRGVVSVTNAAYTEGDAFGTPAVSGIVRAGGFDFTSAYLGSGWYDGLNVTLNGLINGVQSFTRTVTVNTQAPQLFTFNFTGITELDVFSTRTVSTVDTYGCGSSGCSEVTLDDINVTLLDNQPPSVPEPGTVSMLCLALIALYASARLRLLLIRLGERYAPHLFLSR